MSDASILTPVAEQTFLVRIEDVPRVTLDELVLIIRGAFPTAIGIVVKDRDEILAESPAASERLFGSLQKLEARLRERAERADELAEAQKDAERLRTVLRGLMEISRPAREDWLNEEGYRDAIKRYQRCEDAMRGK